MSKTYDKVLIDDIFGIPKDGSNISDDDNEEILLIKEKQQIPFEEKASMVKLKLEESKKELQNIKITGLGGTTLQPAIDYINNSKNKLNIFNTVILTDGYTDHLNFKDSSKRFLILSTSKQPPMTDPKELTKTIIINKDDSMH